MNTAASNKILPHWLKLILVGLAALCGIVLLALAGTYLAWRSNPERLEPVLENVITWVLGRELLIGELLEAELGLNTYLLARDVSLANPSWADEPHFVRAERLLVRINIASIWQSGPIIIDELDVRDIRVSILMPEEEAPNWDFWPEVEVSPELEPKPVKKSEAVFPVIVRRGLVESGVLVYRDGERDIQVILDQLKLQEPHGASLITLDLAGSIDEMPLSAFGTIGPVASILTRKNLRMDILMTWGDLSIESRGSIADLSDLSGPDLSLQIAAPRSRPLLDLLGLEGVRDGPLQFIGRVTDAAPGFSIDAKGSISDFDLVISGTLEDPLNLDAIDLSFMLDGPSLAEAGAAFDVEGLPVVPYEVSGSVYRHGSLFSLSRGLVKMGDGEIMLAGKLPQFPAIDDWELTLVGRDLDFTLLAPLVGVTELPPVTYSVAGQLSSSEQGVELVELTVSSSRGSMTLDGVVGDGPDYFGSSIAVLYQGYDLGITARWFNLENIPHIPFNITGEVKLNDGGWQLLDAEISTADLSVALTGSIDSLVQPQTLDARLRLASPNLAAALTTWRYPVTGLPDYPVQAGVHFNGSLETLQLLEGSVSSGESLLGFSGDIGELSTEPRVSLAVDFQTPDLLDLLPIVSEEALPSLRVDGAGGLTYRDGQMEFDGLKGFFGGATYSVDGRLNPAQPLKNSTINLRGEGPSLRAVLGPWVQQSIPDVPFKVVVDARLDTGRARVDRLEFTTPGTKLFAEIDIADLSDLTSAHGELEFSGPSSQRLVTLWGGEIEVPDEPFKLSAAVESTPDWLRLNPISLVWGRSDYGGRVDVRLDDVPVINADLHSQFLNLSFFLPDLEVLEKEEAVKQDDSEELEQFKLREVLTSEERVQRVIPNEALDFGWMHGVEASLKYKADELHFRDGVSTMALIDFSVSQGVFRTKEVRWEGSFSTGTADIVITALDSGIEAELDLDISRLPLVIFMGGEPNYDTDAMYRVRLKSEGRSLRELAKSSNGALLFKGGGGIIDNRGADLILGDVLEEVTGRLNPFSDTEPKTIVECHAGAVNIVDGKMSINPGLVTRTEKMDMAVGGSVDLHKEELNVTFNSKSRKGVGISAAKAITPYFKIGGTMANPRLVIDATGAAISGGAAVATAGLSILAHSMWDRWVATANNPCERVFIQASEKDKGNYGSLID